MAGINGLDPRAIDFWLALRCSAAMTDRMREQLDLAWLPPKTLCSGGQ